MAGSSRIAATSESSTASRRSWDERSIAERRCATASSRRPARLSQQAGILGIGLDDGSRGVGRLGVSALLVERRDRRPQLPAVRLVRLPRRPAEREDRRARLLGEGGPLHPGRHEHERARRGVDLLVVELEAGPAGVDEVELLVLALLVVLVQNAVAGLVAGPRVDAEGCDVEVVPDRSPGLAAVGDLGDLLDVRQRVPVAHWGASRYGVGAGGAG
jgi:hypothetical protein